MEDNLMLINSVPPLVKDIGGWMTGAEGRLLFVLSQLAPR